MGGENKGINASDQAVISSIDRFGRLLVDVKTSLPSKRSCGSDSLSLRLSERSSARSMNLPEMI